MLNDEEWVTLLETLLARSKGGEIKWHQMQDGVLAVDLGKDNQLQLLSVDRDGNAPYMLTVLHRDPWTEQFTQFAVLNSDDGPNWAANRDRLSELYVMVTRQVGGVANVYNGLLEALGGPVEVPKPAPAKDPWNEAPF
jgi:hypothetical protein